MLVQKPVGPTPHRPARYGLRLRVTLDGRWRSLLETGLMSDTTTSSENTDFGLGMWPVRLRNGIPAAARLLLAQTYE